jgi:hypothetical protein
MVTGSGQKNNRVVCDAAHRADTKTEAHKVAVIYGLHVALPDEMKAFPIELVPLP